MRRSLTLLVLHALAAPAAAGSASGWLEEHAQLHGFVSQGLLVSTENNYLNESEDGDLSFAEAGVNAYLALRPDLSVGAQVFARELGPLGNYQLELDWAFLDWTLRKEAGFRLGAFRLPYGLYNEIADVDAVRPTVLLPQSVYNLQLRDFLTSATGVDAYGSVWTSVGLWSYQLYAGYTRFGRDGSLEHLLDDAGGGAWSVGPIDPIPGAGTSVIWEAPRTGLRTGVTFHRAFQGAIDFRLVPPGLGPGAPESLEWSIDPVDVVVGSVEYTPGAWTLAAEYAQWNGDLENAFFPLRVREERYYVQAARRLGSRLELGSYYSVYYPDRDDREGRARTPSHRGYQKDLALSLRVDVSEHLTAKLEGHDVRGTASVLASENPDGLRRRWRLFATKVTVAF